MLGDCPTHTSRSFDLVEAKDLDRTVITADLMPLAGTKKVHSFKHISDEKVGVRNLSCFCTACTSRDPDLICVSSHFIPAFTELNHPAGCKVPKVPAKRKSAKS